MPSLGFLASFLRSQLFVKLPYPFFDFSNQVVIVTGANTGLGLEAARHFLRLNAAKVILAVRSVKKGEDAVNDLIASTGAKQSRVEVWELDLASHNSVKAFAKKAEQLERLDVVVQNAGILTMKFNLVEEQESTITIDTVNAVLLGILVLPTLQKSAMKHHSMGRLVFVGSDRFMLAKFVEAQIPSETNVVINYLTPGACRSSIFRDDASWASRIVVGILSSIIARSTEEGSRTLVNAASDVVGETHGQFLMDCKVVSPGPQLESQKGQALQARFMEELYERLDKRTPYIGRK